MRRTGDSSAAKVRPPVRPFSVPVESATPHDEGVRRDEGVAPRPRARVRRLAELSVLIVEDEADSRELIELLLSSEGATVRSAGTALEALALFDDRTPDVLLSDIGMPERDGYWLAGQIRARGSAIAAIALTAFSSRDDVERAMLAGFDHHIGKPVDPEQLIRALIACRARLGTERASTA